MKSIVATCVVALALGACTPTSAPTTGVTPTTLCQAVAAIQSNAAATQQLATISPTSALGIAWADFQSGYVNGQPAAGVSPS
jgi:hypothetical protein